MNREEGRSVHEPTASIGFATMVVFFLAYFVLPVLGGLASGLLISTRRRTAAAYCLMASVWLGYKTAETAMSSSAHRKASLPIIAFATILPCLVALLVLSAMRLISWAFRATEWFGKALTTDISTGIARLHELRRRGPLHLGGHTPRNAVKLPWRWVLRLAAFVVMLVIGKNARNILGFMQDHAPRMNVVTNIMDLVSLIFATPKFYSEHARERLHQLFHDLAKSALRHRIDAWDYDNTLRVGAAVFVIILPLLYLVSEWSLSAVPDFVGTMDKLRTLFRSQAVGADWIDQITRLITTVMSGWLLIFNKFNAFAAATVIVSTAMALSLVLGTRLRKLTHRQQEQWENILLFFALVIFAYSRALSML